MRFRICKWFDTTQPATNQHAKYEASSFRPASECMAKSARAVPPSFLSRNVRRVGRLASVVRGASDAIFDFALNWLFFLCSCPHREIRARARAAGRRGAPHQPLLPRLTPCAQGAGGRGGEGRGGDGRGPARAARVRRGAARRGAARADTHGAPACARGGGAAGAAPATLRAKGPAAAATTRARGRAGAPHSARGAGARGKRLATRRRTHLHTRPPVRRPAAACVRGSARDSDHERDGRDAAGPRSRARSLDGARGAATAAVAAAVPPHSHARQRGCGGTPVLPPERC